MDQYRDTEGHEHNTVEPCGEISAPFAEDDRTRAMCTRRRGHDGEHIAADSTGGAFDARIIARWPRKGAVETMDYQDADGDMHADSLHLRCGDAHSPADGMSVWMCSRPKGHAGVHKSATPTVARGVVVHAMWGLIAELLASDAPAPPTTEPPISDVERESVALFNAGVPSDVGKTLVNLFGKLGCASLSEAHNAVDALLRASEEVEEDFEQAVRDAVEERHGAFELAAEVIAKERKLRMTPHESVGFEIGALVSVKQAAYGDSFGRSGAIMEILYPDGIPLAKMGDALTVVRVIDKLFRIATDRDAFGESPWDDVAGYALLEAEKRRRQRTVQGPRGAVGSTGPTGCVGTIKPVDPAKQSG